MLVKSPICSAIVAKQRRLRRAGRFAGAQRAKSETSFTVVWKRGLLRGARVWGAARAGNGEVSGQRAEGRGRANDKTKPERWGARSTGFATRGRRGGRGLPSPAFACLRLRTPASGLAALQTRGTRRTERARYQF